MSNKLVLTAEQIKVLAEFAAKENQPSYTICYGSIEALESIDGTRVREYSGLIAYSDSVDSGVLALDKHYCKI